MKFLDQFCSTHCSRRLMLGSASPRLYTVHEYMKPDLPNVIQMLRIVVHFESCHFNWPNKSTEQQNVQGCKMYMHDTCEHLLTAASCPSRGFYIQTLPPLKKCNRVCTAHQFLTTSAFCTLDTFLSYWKFYENKCTQHIKTLFLIKYKSVKQHIIKLLDSC